MYKREPNGSYRTEKYNNQKKSQKTKNSLNGLSNSLRMTDDRSVNLRTAQQNSPNLNRKKTDLKDLQGPM